MEYLQKKHCIFLLSGLFLFGCAIISGCLQNNHASEMVPTEKTDQISPLPTQVPPMIITPIPENDSQNNGTLQKLPDFQPGNKDALTYEEMQRLMKNYTPPTPVPESEMARIVFSKSWFTQNDKDPRADRVQLTFPVAWLDNPPVTGDEAVVLLRVPKRVLELDNRNPDPGMITVSYPDMYFKEFPNRSAMNDTSPGMRK